MGKCISRCVDMNKGSKANVTSNLKKSETPPQIKLASPNFKRCLILHKSPSPLLRRKLLNKELQEVKMKNIKLRNDFFSNSNSSIPTYSQSQNNTSIKKPSVPSHIVPPKKVFSPKLVSKVYPKPNFIQPSNVNLKQTLNSQKSTFVFDKTSLNAQKNPVASQKLPFNSHKLPISYPKPYLISDKPPLLSDKPPLLPDKPSLIPIKPSLTTSKPSLTSQRPSIVKKPPLPKPFYTIGLYKEEKPEQLEKPEKPLDLPDATKNIFDIKNVLQNAEKMNEDEYLIDDEISDQPMLSFLQWKTSSSRSSLDEEASLSSDSITNSPTMQEMLTSLKSDILLLKTQLELQEKREKEKDLLIEQLMSFHSIP